MKKRIFSWLLALLAALTLVVPAWAEQTADDLFVYDKAGLLSEDEWLDVCRRHLSLRMRGHRGDRPAYLSIR